MKRNRCLTGYVILFMIGSFSAGLTLLLTAIVLQQEQHGPGASSSSTSSMRMARSSAGADPTKHSLKSFATVNVRRQLLNQSLSFVQDVVCGGCRTTVVQLAGGEEIGRKGRKGSSSSGEILPTYRCGDVLRLDSGSAMSSALSAKSPNRTQQALLQPEIPMTSRQRQELSKMCRPHCYECPAARKKYWRYDRVLVPQLPIPILQLLSVPQKHRIPDDALRLHEDGSSNLTEYLRLRADRSLFYFDYNPSIVLLPPRKKPSPSKESTWEEDPFEGAVYVASFRVSTMHSCFRPEVRKFIKRNNDEPADYVGIALLDHRFEIIQDAVFDLKSALNGQGQVQDVRLFVLHDQLYLSSHDWIAPVWIGISGSSADQQPPPPGYRPVRRVFGNLEQRNMDFWMRSFVSCAGCPTPGARKEPNAAVAKSCGKNFNYFTLSNDATKALVEVWPSPPHQVRTVDLLAHCQRDVATERFVDDRFAQATSSFSTVEELHFPGWDASAQQQRRLLTRGRGGACCVELSVRDPVTGKAKQALVGIHHVKTPPQRSPAATRSIIENHYLSRFYAFEPTPPYRMISQSGYFCLGFGTDLNTLNEATRWRSLVLGERFEKCPRIHFVSGMTLKSQDPSTLVITYGINDCVSAIAQVPVKSVQQLLSRGPVMLRQQVGNTAQE